MNAAFLHTATVPNTITFYSCQNGLLSYFINTLQLTAIKQLWVSLYFQRFFETEPKQEEFSIYLLVHSLI